MTPNKAVLLVVSGSWQAGLSVSYERALKRLGLHVVQFELEYERRALAPLGAIGRRVLSHVQLESVNARANRKLVAAALALRPALIMVAGFEPVRPATLVQLKVALPATKIVNLFPDMLFNIRDAMFPCLPLYDLFCCHTRAGIPVLQEIGCKGAFYLPFAADPAIHRPLPLTAADEREFGCDVVYAGTHRPEHAELFAALEGTNMNIWGPTTWRNAPARSWVRSRFRGRPLLASDEYVKAHRAAKVCLNPLDMLDVPGHNMRCFELPACGVFSLVTRNDEVCELFREGETIACFGSADELVDKVRYYLRHPEERERIARAAHAHVIEGGHTYTDRVRTLLDALGLKLGS